MRAPVTLRSQPLTTISTMGGTMARGRVARKAPRRTNSRTPPRPRRSAALGPRPRDPCRAPISRAACAISPGNPSLRRSCCPSSPPAPPRMSSGRHRSAGSAEAFPGTKMRPFATLRVHCVWPDRGPRIHNNVCTDRDFARTAILRPTHVPVRIAIRQSLYSSVHTGSLFTLGHSSRTYKRVLQVSRYS